MKTFFVLIGLLFGIGVMGGAVALWYFLHISNIVAGILFLMGLALSAKSIDRGFHFAATPTGAAPETAGKPTKTASDYDLSN